jgi:hypothetical protein
MKNDLFWEMPSSVDVETFLLKHPPEFKYQKDHFYYIIDYISNAMDLEDLDNNRGFVNLNAKTLQKVIHNYKAYLDHLLNHRFIQTDMKYVVGKKSFGFRLCNYKDHKATVTTIPVTYLPLIKHKRNELNRKQQEYAKTRKQYLHLTKWFNKQLEIDSAGAIAEAERLFPEKTEGIRGTRKGKPSDWARRYKAIQAITKFENQEFYYSVDDNVGRFHSNLTNIKRELRNYITYDGQKLVNVDIKNSQPLFSTLLFDKSFYSEKCQFINIFNIPTILSLLSSTKHSYTTTIIMVVKALEKSEYHDVKDYLKFVNSGAFYEKISKVMHPTATTFDKLSMKKMIFTVFFSNNRYMGQPKAKSKREFKELFPNVYEIFRIIKLRNHSALAHILQRIESEVMIQKVASRISKERPELPIFTIHDSIATTVGNEDYVTAVIQEEVSRLTGLSALLGKEYWESK